MLFAVPPENACWTELNPHVFWSYLHDGVEGRVGADTEVGAGHVVTNGGRQHAHRDAKLLVVGTGLVQLQQRLEGLMMVAAIWC